MTIDVASSVNFNLYEYPNKFSKSLPATILIEETFNNITALGRGLSHEARIITSFAEIVERYNLWHQKSDLESAYDNNSSMLSPTLQVLPQGVQLDNRIVEWKIFSSNETDQIFIHRPISNSGKETYFTHTSNGSSVHQSGQLALKSAREELIERHLFALFWYFESKIDQVQYCIKEIELSTMAGWNVSFYTIKDFEKTTLCLMHNLKDQRFPINGSIIGLSFGDGSNSAMRAYAECIQALEGYLTFDKNINENLDFYLSGEGTEILKKKISVALESTFMSITENILKENDLYYFITNTLHGLYYCEAVIPNLIPLQFNIDKTLRIPSNLTYLLKEVPKYNPLG